ncbi:MAG: cytosolic protein [Bacteroidetes bacterium]|nr:MAG: cytosolic protein [Bacteroidota bacterium]
METEQLTKKEKVKLIFDYFQRTMVHHAMWYAEVRDLFGIEKAGEILENASSLSTKIQLKRLSKTLGFELEDDYPETLMQMEDEKLDALKKAVAVNWLANDGVWFQAVEFTQGMQDAKTCNDAAWSHFSPYEAIRIKKILGLGEFPGLEGLKKAFYYRIYADVNKQSIGNETENSFDFYMNECRVQMARKRKGLDDYPCKSGGIIEYSTFAATIDKRIKTSVIGCPPDKHPEEWFCGWHFYIEK